MIECISRDSMDRLRVRFERLYGKERAEWCLERAAMLAGRYGVGLEPRPTAPWWSERDAMLITYGDMVRREGEPPLATLARFMEETVGGTFTMLHVLPFFPYSSDDGFAIESYRMVNPALGTWEHIQKLGRSRRLMVDLVLNHCSRRHPWLKDYVTGIDPYRSYFIQVDPVADLSSVVRPRTSPLLSRFHTRSGERWLWATFGDDQIDLNFAEPDVLFEFLDILISYIANGAKMIRLDAVAFLWKRPGTPCIHLPETHEVVKLIRDMLKMVAPDVLIVTETNVPHEENISYFGRGDEAHMVYQFSMPPLVLHGLLSGSARYLAQWAAGVSSAPPGCTYLNFTASHDGIGVRPLEGLVPADAVDRLVAEVTRRGGHVSSRAVKGGAPVPYELNTTFYDALGFADGARPDGLHMRRFLCSQAIPMSMKGVPAFYFNSLLAGRNDAKGFEALGYPRALNRGRWREEEIARLLVDEGSPAATACREITRLLGIRSCHPAFHPDAGQRVLDIGEQVFGIERTALDGSEKVVCVHNMTGEAVAITASPGAEDLLGGGRVAPDGRIDLNAYDVKWLAAPSGTRNHD